MGGTLALPEKMRNHSDGLAFLINMFQYYVVLKNVMQNVDLSLPHNLAFLSSSKPFSSRFLCQ